MIDYYYDYPDIAPPPPHRRTAAKVVAGQRDKGAQTTKHCFVVCALGSNASPTRFEPLEKGKPV
jgi:hypothetical protein